MYEFLRKFKKNYTFLNQPLHFQNPKNVITFNDLFTADIYDGRFKLVASNCTAHTIQHTIGTYMKLKIIIIFIREY